MASRSSADQGSKAWPAAPYAWYVVFVLFLAYVFAFIDRQILSLMVEPIKADLDLSDTQISILHGFAFVLLYTFAGIPVGRLVDRSDRRLIVSIGIGFWSIMTAACGLARGFWSLFLCRVGVGVGEATLTPSAYSLISDYFPPESRARALAVYTLGVTIGSGLALIIGGTIYDAFVAAGDVKIPVFGVLAAWQLTFIAIGLPGLLVMLLMFTIREPVRRGTLKASSADAGQDGLSLRDAAVFVWRRIRVYGFLFVGLGLLSMVSYSFTWFPALFFRKFEWTPGQYGQYVGWLFMISGSLGILAAGWLSDALTKRGRDDALIVTLIGFSGFSAIFAVLTTLGGTPTITLVFYSVMTFFLMAPFGVAPGAIQAITVNEMRGQVSAIYLFVMNLLGLGLGPVVVAVITDYVFRDEAMIGASMLITCAVLGPLAVLTLCLAYHPFIKAKQAEAGIVEEKVVT